MKNNFLPLSKLMSQGRPRDFPVAHHNQGLVSWSTFVQHTGSLAIQIRDHGIGRWLLFCENTYGFAVGLMAIWQSGSTAVLPPNSQENTLKELNHEVLGFVTDLEAPFDEIFCLSPFSDGQQYDYSWQILEKEGVKVELLTSGSTGARKVVKKTITHLEDELFILEKTWGSYLQETEIFATVSHQHIYGLLFRLLWPLSAGRVFRSETYLSPNELLSHLKTCGQTILVSGPAHLKRMPELIELSELKPCCHLIFSSGGLLKSNISKIFQESIGIIPYEILGSTETGGIAWRQQQNGIVDTVWTVFENVNFKIEPPDHFLAVQSPFISETQPNEWFVTGDQAEMISAETFLLKGRGDRIVKIEEKRLSLPEMENLLDQHSWIDASKVLLLDLSSTKRPPLAAALSLTVEGKEQLATIGRWKFAKGIKDYLLQSFDPILLPRKWRYVESFPEDAQGKVILLALQQLFIEEQWVQEPKILEEKKEENAWLQQLTVPDNLEYLNGHFSDFPIVPGVVQLQWTLALLHKMIGSTPLVERIEVLKFKNPLLPNSVFWIEVKNTSTQNKYVFQLWSEEHEFASGRILLKPNELAHGNPL